jgi:redox-sensitive bicupin YhaK (pirin superfamily)
MEILHKKNIVRSGFAGIREHQMVKESSVFGRKPLNDKSWDGIGNFVYLSDANFIPKGETGMHPHREIDVISFMVKGRVLHEGTLEHGKILDENEIQIQRGGGEGFYHNEINPDSIENRMIQMWCIPEITGQKSDYKKYTLKKNSFTKIYGGDKNSNETFNSHTHIEIGAFSEGAKFSIEQQFLAYITKGIAHVNGEKVQDGDFIRGKGLHFEAIEDSQIIMIYEKGG